MQEWIHDVVLELVGVTMRRSHFSDTPAFYVNGKEFLHFHSETEIDLRLTRREISRRRVVLDTNSGITRRSSGSDWLAIDLLKFSHKAALMELISAAAAANANRQSPHSY